MTYFIFIFLFKAKQLKRFSVTILFGIMFCSQLGYYIGGKAIQLVLKELANERMLMTAPDSCLVAIPLQGNENNIEWEEQDRELTYRGHLYDVVRIKKINNTVVYLCIDDKLEDALVSRLNDLTKSNHQPAGKCTGVPGVKLVYMQDAVCLSCQPAALSKSIFTCIDYQDMLQYAFSSITVPPPRV